MQSETKLKSFLNTKKLYDASLYCYSHPFGWTIGGLLFANDQALKIITTTDLRVGCSIFLNDVIEFDEKNNLVMTKDETFEIIMKDHDKPNFWNMLKDKTGLS